MSVRYLCCACRGTFTVASDYAFDAKTEANSLICPCCGDKTGIVKSLSFKVWGTRPILSDMPYIGAWQDDYIKTINKDVSDLKTGKTLKRRIAGAKRPMFTACNKVVDKENNKRVFIFKEKKKLYPESTTNDVVEHHTEWCDDGIARITFGSKIGLAMKASPEFRTTALRTFNKEEKIEKEFDGELEAASITSRARDVLYALNGEKNENDEVITPSYAARVNDTVPFIWKGVEINRWTKAKIDSLREGLVAIYDYQAFAAPEKVESEWSNRLLTTKQLLKLTLDICNASQRDSFPISMSKMDIDGVMEELYPHTPKREVMEGDYHDTHGSYSFDDKTQFFDDRAPRPIIDPDLSVETFWKRFNVSK